MTEHKEKKRSEKNIYKITTFALVGVILLAFLAYGIAVFGNYKYVEGIRAGQNDVVNYVLENSVSKGEVSFELGDNQSLVLVPMQYVRAGQEQVILEIMKNVQEKGYITLYNNETEMVLVQYEVPNQDVTSSLAEE